MSADLERVKVFSGSLPCAAPDTKAVLHVKARPVHVADGTATVSTELTADECRALIADLRAALKPARRLRRAA